MSVEYPAEFNNAVEFTLRKEGVLSNDPDDKGGLTKYGVTAETWATYLKLCHNHPSLPATVALITPFDAVDCYYSLFWLEPCFDKLPRELQGAAFDFAVNSGADNAIKALQYLVGAVADGKLGPATLAKIAGHSNNLRKLRNDYVLARIFFDVSLHQAKFELGWVHRCVSLLDFGY